MGVASASPPALGALVRRERPPRRLFPELAAGGVVFEQCRCFRFASPMVHGAWLVDEMWADQRAARVVEARATAKRNGHWIT
ncbi:hypothetical protein N9L68_07155 [bacterium]|nr:hypothetical protein [bacterium]